MKIMLSAFGIMIVVVSAFVAIFAHRDVKETLDIRTDQIEKMIDEHRQIVYRNHDTLMNNEKRLIQITLDQNKVLEQIADNGKSMGEVVRMNREILEDLKKAIPHANQSNH